MSWDQSQPPALTREVPLQPRAQTWGQGGLCRSQCRPHRGVGLCPEDTSRTSEGPGSFWQATLRLVVAQQQAQARPEAGAQQVWGQGHRQFSVAPVTGRETGDSWGVTSSLWLVPSPRATFAFLLRKAGSWPADRPHSRSKLAFSHQPEEGQADGLPLGLREVTGEAIQWGPTSRASLLGLSHCGALWPSSGNIHQKRGVSGSHEDWEGLSPWRTGPGVSGGQGCQS